MLHRTLVPALMLVSLVALLSLSGCAVAVGYEDAPEAPDVGQRLMVQQRTAAAAVTPAPQPQPQPEPPKPQPLDAVASSSIWSLLAGSAGTLIAGTLTSVPTCDAATGAQSTQGATAELQISLAPWRGKGCSVMLTGALGLTRDAPARGVRTEEDWHRRRRPPDQTTPFLGGPGA